MGKEDDIVLLACGDIGPIFEPIEPLSALVRPILATGHIRFGHCERVYSERGMLQVHATVSHTRVPPHMASVFTDCRFNVVSMAGNHAMEWGADALLDTIDLFKRMQIQTIGAGRNLQEAREPAMIEHNGVRVALLGYCSILAKGCAATHNKPGIAPLRAHTYYRPLVDNLPGIPAQVVTVPYEDDLEGMVQDVENAKKTAHVVVVSIHWGLQHIPRMIADYQTMVAKAAFRAGAGLILGHHAHVPKAIGVYDGKVCFYSLGNFIISVPPIAVGEDTARAKLGVSLDSKDTKRALIAKALLSRAGASKVSFLPVLLDQEHRPDVLRSDDPRFDEAVKYVDWASEGYDHKFTVEGDEVIVS